jgi:hypothetical protein
MKGPRKSVRTGRRDGGGAKKLGAGVFAFLLASCGPAEQVEPPPEINVDVPRPPPEPPTRPPTRPVVWTCEQPAGSGVRNKWWGWFTACAGDVSVRIEADSIYLGGPKVRFEVHRRACPAGKSIQFGHVGDAFFERSFDEQLTEIQGMVTESLAQLHELCGKPTNASSLYGPDFDRAFRELADYYWLHLSKAKIRKSRAS